MEIPNISNDKIIIFFLGVALILLILNHQPEYYNLIIAGLLGVAGVNKFNQNRIESTIQTSIKENLNYGEDQNATESDSC